MLIIDRFEGDFAVVEDGERVIKVKKELFDAECAEGDVIERRDGLYYPDKEKTRLRREEMLLKMKKLGL